MKSATIGMVKATGRKGVPSPRKKELLGSSPQKECKDHLRKDKYP